MIPKMDIQHYIYILLNLIYVPLIVQNWKFQNRLFKTTYIITYSYIYVPLISRNWKSKKDKI